MTDDQPSPLTPTQRLRAAARTLSDAYWPMSAGPVDRMSKAINEVFHVADEIDAARAGVRDPLWIAMENAMGTLDEVFGESDDHVNRAWAAWLALKRAGVRDPEEHPDPTLPEEYELSAPDLSTALDVERLARAIEYTGDGEGDGYRGARYREYAANLAREYAALAHPETEEPTDGR